MKKNKIISMLLSIIMVFSIVQLPTITVLAQEQQTQAKQEIPSNWAIPDVNTGFYLNLLTVDDLRDYKKPITLEQTCKVAVNTYQEITGEKITINSEDRLFNNYYEKAILANILTGLEDVNRDQELTKEEVILLMYNIVRESNEEITKNSEDAVEFFKENDLIKGNKKGELLLNNKITKQEVYVLAKRVFDFTLRSLDKYSKGMFYKVSGGKNQLYILGSIHIADKTTYPLSQSIEDVFAESDCLVEEADLSNQGDAMYMLQKGTYTGDDNIKNHISEEVYNKYIARLKEFNLENQLDQYNKYKPWFAACLLTNLNANTKAMIAQLGIDVYLMNKCVYENKEFDQLEGIRFQTDMFDGMNDELQEQFLASNLVENTEEGDNTYAQALKVLLDAWKDGDVELLTKLVTTPEEQSTEFDKKLLDERNVNMIEKIKEYLNDDTGRKYIVVFGAAHLYNETGVLKGLTDAGYEVEQILK